jgi:trimeric autotransporter adhesin
MSKSRREKKSPLSKARRQLQVERLEDRRVLSAGFGGLAAFRPLVVLGPPAGNVGAAVAQASLHGQPAARATTTSTLSLSTTSPTAYGTPITAYVTVAANGTPTGLVAILVNGRQVQTVSVAAAAAGVSITPDGGSDTITAKYLGDKMFAASTSNAVSEQVTPDTTSIILQSSIDSTTFGQAIQFTATVTAGTSTLPVRGWVQFLDNGAAFAAAPIFGSQGQASLWWRSLSVGSHTITAQFVANNNYQASGPTDGISEDVSEAASTTALVSSKNPLPSGQSVTFTAYVLSDFGSPTPTAATPALAMPNYMLPIWLGPPTGTVTFTAAGANGTVTSDPVPVSNGRAIWTPATLADDVYSVTAEYKPDDTSNYGGSTSAALTETVGGLASTTLLTASASPVKTGTQVTFTVTVASGDASSSAVPQGTVTLVDQSDQDFTPLTASPDPVTGVATFSALTLSKPGVHSFLATYTSSDGVYAGSQAGLREWVLPLRPWFGPRPMLF